jgi:hypothetical protein
MKAEIEAKYQHTVPPFVSDQKASRPSLRARSLEISLAVLSMFNSSFGLAAGQIASLEKF